MGDIYCVILYSCEQLHFDLCSAGIYITILTEFLKEMSMMYYVNMKIASGHM